MMKAKLAVLLACLALLGGCRRKQPALVPELSPPLMQEEICSWQGNLAGSAVFPYAGGVGWVDAAGRIVSCDVGRKSIGAVFTVPFSVAVPPLVYGNLLLFRDKATDRLLVYDLAAGAVKFEALRLGANNILGAGAEGLVCLEDQRPIVRLWHRPGEVFRAPEAGEKFFNCHFSPERILILGDKRLFVFHPERGRFESLTLPRPAASPFLCVGEDIYYGSTRRSLVKFQLRSGRAEWELKLGQILQRQPSLFSDSIVVCPGDQNVIQVNRRGSIVWWQALGSTLEFDLLPMGAHLAAFLMNREIRLLDPKLRQDATFKGAGRPLAAPLAVGGDLFYLTRDGETCRLQRVGSRFGVSIELEPAPGYWLNSSLRFKLHFYNLPDPSWECIITDSSGKQAFSKSMNATGSARAGQYGPLALAWVPLRPGDYTIRLRATSLGRDWLSEVPVRVIDPLWMIRMLFPVCGDGK